MNIPYLKIEWYEFKIRIPKFIRKLIKPLIIRKFFRSDISRTIKLAERVFGTGDIDMIVGYNWDMVFEYYSHV